MCFDKDFIVFPVKDKDVAPDYLDLDTDNDYSSDKVEWNAPKIGNEIIVGENVITVSFDLTDGKEFNDDDRSSNAVILDPSGIAILQSDLNSISGSTNANVCVSRIDFSGWIVSFIIFLIGLFLVDQVLNKNRYRI